MQRNRRVRFSHRNDDEFTHYGPITAERLTSEIRNCYDSVDKGRKLLGRLYDKLRQRDENERYDSFRRDYQLLIELDNLKDVLQSIAEKRGSYIRQLEMAQDIVWHDRREMEEFLRLNKATERRLQEKVKFFSRFSQEPEFLVTELQENSQILGELLSDLREQLIAEEQFIKRQRTNASHGNESTFSGSPRDRWIYIRGRRRGSEDLGREDLARRDDGARNDYEERYYTPELKPSREFEFAGGQKGDASSKDGCQYRKRNTFEPEDARDRDPTSSAQYSPNDARDGRGPPSGRVGESASEKKDDYDTSSLSQKLRQLVKQSENVQKLISDSSKKVDIDNRNDTKCAKKSNLSQPLLPNQYFKKSPQTVENKSPDHSILGQEKSGSKQPVEASGPAQAVEVIPRQSVDEEAAGRHDRNIHDDSDALRRSFESVLEKCEEVERKIQGCSPKEICEKLLQNLDELDRADQEADRILSSASPLRHREYSCKAHVDHDHIRQEFVKCLDKIFAMEKCYGSAGDEIRNLKRDLELALRDRDSVEHSLRIEVEKLHERLQLKAKDVDFYRERVRDLKKELFDLKTKYETELASVEAHKDNEDDVKLLKDECEQLKEKVDTKSKEVDELRKDLENAIEEIHILKAAQPGKDNTEVKKTKETVTSIETVFSASRGTTQENISEELAALQKVIEIAEENQRKSLAVSDALRKENARLSAENSKLVNDSQKLRSILGKFGEEKNEELRNRIEELELVLIAKDAEIDQLSKRGFRTLDDPDKVLSAVELKIKEEECRRLRKKLSDYEDLIAKDGGDMSRRLDEMYEECVKSVEKINREKEVLEEDFQRQRLMYEDLLAECHNEISELNKRGKEVEKIMSHFQPGKREVLETLLTSVRSPEELAEILSRDLEDGPKATERLVSENKQLQKENEKMQQKVEKVDNKVTAYQREIDSLKKKNRELKDKSEHLKSENYLLSRIRGDDGGEKLKTYKELLGRKEEECFRLRKILDESIDYEERDELLARLREVHRELLQDGTIKEELSLESLQESLEKRDKEIRRLKRQNRLLTDSLGLDEAAKRAVLESILASNEDLGEFGSENRRSPEKMRMTESENRDLKRQISELDGKLKDAGKLEDEVKGLKKSVKRSEDQCHALEDENFSLRERLRGLQSEIKELSFLSRSRKLSKDKASDDLVKENEHLNEKILLKDLENERLEDEISDLKTDLRRCENEAVDLKERLETKSQVSEEVVSLRQENVEKDEILKDLSKKLGVVEKERKKINEAYIKQKVKNEEDTKHMSDQIKKLQNEVSNAASSGKKSTPVDLLNVSQESLSFDEKDGGITRYDRNRLIKKLQEENHQQSARLLSLEEETTAITKLIADMERGHGHLTGILRGHLVLQKDATAKLLEKSLQQYSDEFESCKKKFRAVENKYDKNRINLTRRRFAWDLFENATATVDNITAILVEGLIKVEEDLHDEFSSDEDFETRDYKSRIWLLRRRLDDVEKRYRDLMLRAEELSVRLDAKTAEYDVTQDELEDATRVLEVNEITLARMRDELSASLKENSRLKGIMSQLKENQERTVGAVIEENEQLKKEIDRAAEDRTEIDSLQLEMKDLRDKLKLDDFEVREVRRRLHEQERREKETVDNLKEDAREAARKYEEEASKLQNDVKLSKKKIGESAARINELDNLLKKAEEKIANLEKYLQKARSGCRSDGIDHHSTIHMLRDDLKKLFKENEGLKEEINNKQRRITALAKDLREAKINVKEQLGTERSLDEKMLDRAAKDQIMALKRRIKVLEMENARLVKKANNLERDQSLADSVKKKKVPRTSSSLGELSSSLRNDEGDGKTEDSSKKGDDTIKSVSSGIFGNEEDADNSLASIESFKDFSNDNKEEIELRDNLIKELEARVRELKQELAKKTGEEKSSVRDGSSKSEDNARSLDLKSIAEKDLQMLKKENSKLKEALEKQKNAPVSYQVKQKDDVIKRQRAKLTELEEEVNDKDWKLKALQKELAEMRIRVGGEWRSKEFVLLDSDEYKELEKQRSLEIESLKEEVAKLEDMCKEQNSTIEKLEQGRKGDQVGEDEIQAVSEFSVDGASHQMPEKDSGYTESTSKRAPKFINLSKTPKNQSSSESGSDKPKTLSRIPISPRPKQATPAQSKADAKKELEKRVEEQNEDITTLLQSVDYFEKEVEKLQKQVEEVESLKEKLRGSEMEVKNLKTKNTKLQNQAKETKSHDEKLQVLEDKIKKLNTENRNLELQMRKLRRSETERARSPTEALPKKITNLERELNNTKKQLEAKSKQIGLFKSELGMKDMSSLDDEKKLKNSINESVQKRVKKERDTAQSDAKKKIELIEKEKERLQVELNEKNNSNQKYADEIFALKANLEEAEKKQDLASSDLEQSRDSLSYLETELDKVKARNVALEAVQDAFAHSDELHDANSKEKSCNRLKEAWEDLKGLLKDLFTISEDDFMSTSSSVDEIATDIQKVSIIVEDYSKRFGDELGEQRKANFDLEIRVDEFRKIVEETSSRITELEDEVSEKEKGDEIGHKLMLDQIDSLKKNVEKLERDKVELEEEVNKREDYIERLSGQVKFLERQVSQRDIENSELTQRALDSEEELEHLKARIEELEDDYNKLLQYGMRLDDSEEGNKKAKKEEDKDLLKMLKDTIASLEEDKSQLETRIEELIVANEERDKFGEDKTKEEEYQGMEDAIYRLELDNADLQKRANDAEKEGHILEEKLEESEKKVKSLEDAMFRIELEKASLQKAFDEAKVGDGKGDKEMHMKIAQLEEENSRMEDAIFHLDVEREGLRKRINELTSDEKKGDVNDLTLLLIDNEEKIADLEQEKKILQAKEENLQKTMDEILQSPRSDEEDESDENREILKGGPKSWKRRLIAAYREIREKSTELAMMKMIVESKNVEVDLLSKEVGEDSISEGISSLSEDETSGRRNTRKQLKATVFMLQEEVKIKSSEIKDLKNEISLLKNTLEVQESRGVDGPTVRINGREEIEVKNEELEVEVNRLGNALSEKEEQYESLCDQLFGGEPIITASVNTQLKNEIESLKAALAAKDKQREELEENYELVYNELTRIKAGDDGGGESGMNLMGHEEKAKMLEKALEDYEEKYRLMNKDFDELEERYGEEMNYASTHIGQLMLQVGELEGQLQDMREKKVQKEDGDAVDQEAELMIVENRLKNTEDDLRRKNELISNLKETLANIYENSGDQSGESVILCCTIQIHSVKGLIFHFTNRSARVLMFYFDFPFT